jgi:hypothetical protein
VTRLLPQGEAIKTWGDKDAPQGFVWRGAPHHIRHICNRWRVHTRWWESGETMWREYWKVTTDQGILCQLYHDLLDGGWFLSRLYD